METECNGAQLEFQGFGRRRVIAAFDGGRITSDAGVLLLRETAAGMRLFERLSACFVDHRSPEQIEHRLEELLAQRVLGLAQGYEDLNDHDVLRDDPLLALAAGKRDLYGEERARERDRGHALAGKSTLNRLERSAAKVAGAERYRKIAYDGEALKRLLVELFLDAHQQAPAEVVLDLDSTDDPLHGHQEGRFFHGFYRSYCYLPLYIFCGDFLLAARLRSADRDGADGAIEEVARIVAQIRERWGAVKIIVRADSGFAREALMAWCEAHGVDFVFGLARNARLEAMLEEELAQAKAEHQRSGEAVRRFKDFRYRTLDSWSRARRVVGKAEYLPGKANPRFVVTSLSIERMAAAPLYEEFYCARGDMENRIKEQQLGLFADRTSAATMRANQLRLWFSSFAYALVNELRRVGLGATALARAQVSTIRVRLLKLGASVAVSVRRVKAALSSAFPLKELFAAVLANLRRTYPLRL